MSTLRETIRTAALEMVAAELREVPTAEDVVDVLSRYTASLQTEADWYRAGLLFAQIEAARKELFGELAQAEDEVKE